MDNIFVEKLENIVTDYRVGDWVIRKGGEYVEVYACDISENKPYQIVGILSSDDCCVSIINDAGVNQMVHENDLVPFGDAEEYFETPTPKEYHNISFSFYCNTEQISYLNPEKATKEEIIAVITKILGE